MPPKGARTVRPLAIDLFSGAGGLSLGFEQAGFDVAVAVELDPVHAAVHEFNFPNTKMMCRDIRKLGGDDIRLGSRVGNSDVAVVFGGPPCQGISLIGKRDVSDPRNELLFEFARIVREIEPACFVMENVAGLVVGEHRHLLESVTAQFRGAGYEIAEPQVLQAADYGVPQSRRRLFLAGWKRGLASVPYPKPRCAPRKTDGSPGESVDTLPLGPSVREALGDLPDADLFPELLRGDSVRVRYGSSSGYAKRLRCETDDPTDYSSPRNFDRGMMTSSARTRHTEKSIDRFSATLPGTTEPVSRFFRLHPDGISNTLRAGTASDRGAYTAPRPIHPWLSRVITVREAARLHGYPDWFRFHVTKWNGFREIGNSVPVPLAKAVASSVMASLSLCPTAGCPTDLGDERLLAFSQTEAERHFGLTSRVIPQRNRK